MSVLDMLTALVDLDNQRFEARQALDRLNDRWDVPDRETIAAYYLWAKASYAHDALGRKVMAEISRLENGR